jgi:hypothetical protein
MLNFILNKKRKISRAKNDKSIVHDGRLLLKVEETKF